MTDTEIVQLMQSGEPIAKARMEFSAAYARIEQALQQRRPISIIEVRRMEFDAVRKIAAALGAVL
jgi:hypothetical protein